MSDIPRSMEYAMSKSTAVEAQTNLRQFASNNGTTFSTSVNEIRINVAADGFLDGTKSYLYFTIKNENLSAGQNLKLDSDALSWIDQIRVESQGLVLERLERTALYANLKGRWTDGITRQPSRNAKMGGPLHSFGDANDGALINETASEAFACKLPLGMLNAHHGRAIPQGASFDIVIRVNATAALCFKWENAAATAFSILNPRFYAPVYRIENAEVMAEYNVALKDRGIMWSGDVVKTYINSMTAGAGTKTAQINDRSASLKALVTVARSNTIVADATKNSVGSSQLLGITQMRYVIAGQNYPQDTIQYSNVDIGRLYEECQKAMARDGETYCEPVCFRSAFIATNEDGQGTLAVDLKKFNDERLMMTGMNTANSASPNLLELTTDATAVASDLTTFAICESVFVLDGRGSMTASA